MQTGMFSGHGALGQGRGTQCLTQFITRQPLGRKSLWLPCAGEHAEGHLQFYLPVALASAGDWSWAGWVCPMWAGGTWVGYTVNLCPWTGSTSYVMNFYTYYTGRNQFLNTSDTYCTVYSKPVDSAPWTDFNGRQNCNIYAPLHVAVTYDNSTGSFVIYVNGLVFALRTTSTWTAQNGYNKLMYGTWRDVQFYNRCLSPAEVIAVRGESLLAGCLYRFCHDFTGGATAGAPCFSYADGDTIYNEVTDSGVGNGSFSGSNGWGTGNSATIVWMRDTYGEVWGNGIQCAV